MPRSRPEKLLGLCLALFAGPALAGPFFSTSNQGAFAREFLLPALGESSVLADGDWSWRAQLDQTNDFYLGSAGAETITLDGETTRLGYVLTQGLGSGFEWGFEVPIYYQGRGFMDSFIEDWHGWFGMPNGGRELAPHDRYLFEVTNGGAVLYRNTETGAALGDLRLNGGWQWSENLALRAALQLPTGDGNRLTGETGGGALWADAALPFSESSRWRGFISLGATAAQRGQLLRELRKRAVAIGGFGLSFSCTEALRLTAQLYSHTPLYQGTDLDALKRPGLQAVFGGSYSILPNAILRLAVQEDPVTSSSPDFSVHIALELMPPD